MKLLRSFLLAGVALIGLHAHADNYAQCLIDNLQGVRNQASHATAMQMCAKQHPKLFYDIQKGSGRSWLSSMTGDKCTLKFAKDATFNPSALAIKRACTCLYDKGDEPCDIDWSQFTPIQ